MQAPISRRSVMAMGFGALTALSATAIITNARRIPRIPQGLAVALADIPIGGGKVVLAHQVVVTRSDDKTYHALHTICPHDNCDIGDVNDEQIICYCHGSLWELSGKIKRGPARKSLAKRDHEIIDETFYVTDVNPADLIEDGDSATRDQAWRR